MLGRMAALLLLLGAWAGADTLDVLFLGNSYTYGNDLPGLVRDLSASGGRTVMTDQNTPGGYTLEEHSTDQQSLDRIALGNWNFVVLQEQSQIPTIPYWRDSSMYPAARMLDSLIRGQNPGRPCFFMTWGRKYGGQQHRGGHSSPDFRDFFHMQESLRTAYGRIATELAAELAPVGMGWARAKTLNPDVDLWTSDNSHPTIRGSYLAACVFHATLFNETPVGLGFHAGLDSAEARFLQECAEYAVLGVEEKPGSRPSPARLDICPNPCRGRVRARWTGRAGILRLTDVAGRVVFERPVAGPGSKMLDLSLVPPGIYLLEVLLEEKRTSVMLVRL